MQQLLAFKWMGHQMGCSFPFPRSWKNSSLKTVNTVFKKQKQKKEDFFLGEKQSSQINEFLQILSSYLKELIRG